MQALARGDCICSRRRSQHIRLKDVLFDSFLLALFVSSVPSFSHVDARNLGDDRDLGE